MAITLAVASGRDAIVVLENHSALERQDRMADRWKRPRNRHCHDHDCSLVFVFPHMFWKHGRGVVSLIRGDGGRLCSHFGVGSHNKAHLCRPPVKPSPPHGKLFNCLAVSMPL